VQFLETQTRENVAAVAGRFAAAIRAAMDSADSPEGASL
jgi:hypothetical protein